jgi:hypothetical protein
MEPLSEAACEQVSLRIVDCPASVMKDEEFPVRVEVMNRGQAALGSFFPCPVHLSYRWLNASGEEVSESEGVRTVLRPRAVPGWPETYTMIVRPPAQEGEHRLRLTLVQETVTWFDTLARPVFADARVSVMPSAASPGPPGATSPESAAECAIDSQ